MNTAARTGSRGQPLLLLGALLVGWFGLRVVTWQSPFPIGVGSPAMAESNALPITPANPAEPASGADPHFEGSDPSAPNPAERPAEPATHGEWLRRPLPADAPVSPGWSQLPLLSPAGALPVGSVQRLAQANGSVPRGLSASAASGHALLLAAGLSRMEMPAALFGLLDERYSPAGLSAPPALARRVPNPAFTSASAPISTTASAPVFAPASAPAGAVPAIGAPRPSRWTADGWLLLREDSASSRQTGLQGYGRSQAGAVLRYRLAPSSGQAPQAHLRASTALANAGNRLRERELAAGLSARPLASVPVRVAAELRLSDLAQGTELRPAAYAVTELPPVALPLGARGELYLQGGWVGGTFKTAFVDGQARVDRPLVRLGPAELSAGAGAWGGAQRDAERLDAGPSLAATLSIGRVRARATADYRFRIAGDAQPGSGPVLTVYAGF